VFFDDERTSKTHADYPLVHGDTKNVEVGDTRKLTGFSHNGEYLPDTFSEPRGSDLRASEQNLMDGSSQGTQGQLKARFPGKSARLSSQGLADL
jgi:hypothetical protein